MPISKLNNSVAKASGDHGGSVPSHAKPASLTICRDHEDRPTSAPVSKPLARFKPRAHGSDREAVNSYNHTTDHAMVAIMSWATVLATALGSGTTAALVTAYASQSRERRVARAQVRAAVIHVERTARQGGTTPSDLLLAVGEVEDAAFVAAVSRSVIEIYRDARNAADEAERVQDDPREYAYPDLRIARGASQKANLLFALVLWHPLLSIPVRRLRASQLRRYLNSGLREPRLYERPVSRRDQRRAIRDRKRADSEFKRSHGS